MKRPAIKNSKKKKRSAVPIRKIAGNVVFSKNGPWACFRVRCRSYASEPERRQGALMLELANFAYGIEADFQILRVSRRFSATEYVERLRRATPRGARKQLWEDYLDGQYGRLADLESWRPMTFVCVRLADPEQDVHGKTSRAFETLLAGEAWQSFKDRHGRDEEEDEGPKEKVADVLRRARDVERSVQIALDARPASVTEIQWLIRRAFRRGQAEPPLAPEDSANPERALRLWFGETGFQHHARHVWIEGDFGESYQAGLCVGEVLHAQPFSRQVELMFTPLEDHAFPIDAALNVRFIPNEQAARQTDRLRKRGENQLRDEAEGVYGTAGETERSVELAQELHDRLGAYGEPILWGTLSYLVAADSKAEVERRARAVQKSFPWPLYRPYGDQLDLWKQHLPGQPSLVRGLERAWTPEQVGAMVPHATHEAGSSSERALYVARSQYGRQPTFFDLGEASKTDKPPTIALLGTLGGGKTMCLQLLMYQAFIQGGRVVDIDPKGDHRFHLMPEVAPHTQTIHLSDAAEHAGKLDPLRIAPRGERHDAAATFLTDVLHDPDSDVRASINGAVARVLEEYGDQACCTAVVEELQTLGEKAGDQLGKYMNAGIVRLGFARLEDPLPSTAAGQVTYLNIRALKRAGIETVRSEMSQSQRHGRAVLQLVALYAMKILGEDRDRLKVLAFDEASFLTEDAMGHQLLDTLQRWGRSEYAVPIISSQLLGDVVEQDNLVGHWFVFAMKARSQAVRTLEALELDAQGPLATRVVEKYGAGRCLYVDLDRRCEEIQTDPGEDLIRALSTTPTEKEDFSTKRAAPSLMELVETM